MQLVQCNTRHISGNIPLFYEKSGISPAIYHFFQEKSGISPTIYHFFSWKNGISQAFLETEEFIDIIAFNTTMIFLFKLGKTLYGWFISSVFEVITTTVLACTGKNWMNGIWLRNDGDWYRVWKDNWMNGISIVDLKSRVNDPEKWISNTTGIWSHTQWTQNFTPAILKHRQNHKNKMN